MYDELKKLLEAKSAAHWEYIDGLEICQLLALIAEVERLKGLLPDFPPRPPDGEGLPRYGLRWNGPQQPLAVLMGDGYWTPWHLAEQLKAENARSTEREILQLAEIESLRKAVEWTIQVHRDPELEHEIRHEEWLEGLEAAMRSGVVT